MTRSFVAIGLIVNLSLVAAGMAQPVNYIATKANDGNLLMEDVPRVPQSVIDDLTRFQNIRAAGVLDWSKDGKSLFITTRFADVNQVHRVDAPGGARHQLTFFHEPIGDVRRRRSVGHVRVRLRL